MLLNFIYLQHWVSGEYWKPGPDGNDIHKTNVPNLRLRFRYESYVAEISLIIHGVMGYEARVQTRKHIA